MCGSDEPHLYPERSSPTILSTSGHASYKRAIVYNGFERYFLPYLLVLCNRLSDEL